MLEGHIGAIFEGENAANLLRSPSHGPGGGTSNQSGLSSGFKKHVPCLYTTERWFSKKSRIKPTHAVSVTLLC